ncbi:MAG: hypothetical protein IPK16_09165 [Anaerolineales bacterium]|nr:hypothetical protein [Anaerolineales bacterium]
MPSIWEILYDNTKSELAATTTVSLTYPADGYEAVGTPPVLGWLPVTRTGQYAGSYRVQVSRNPGFTDLVNNVSVPYINFVPWQGHDGPMPIGTYWWRVRVEDGIADAASQWSTPRSFNLAYNLITGNQFDFPHDVLYDPGNTLVAASETTTGDAYELDNLYVMLDRRRNGSLNWVTAFDIHPDGSPVRYWLYFDTDRKTTSSCPAPGNAIGPVYGNIGAYDLFKPEYAISVDRDGSGIANTNYYRWTGVSFNPNCTWVLVNTLPNIGGIAELNGNAIQLHIPYTALGTADDNFSGNAGITLFSTSASNTSDIMHDTIPAQGVLLANPAGMIDHPAFVSDMLMPLYPFDTPLSNPYTFFDMPALRWRMPIFGSIDGYEVEVARDERFTQRIERWETYENRASFYFSLLPTAFQSMNVYSDNESYYWRVRIRHEYYTKYATDFDYGPWSPPQRFKLSSRQVGNPRTSTGDNVFMTPAFIWDRVEGAAGYSLQIDDDSKFGSPLIDIETPNPSYTPPELNELQSLLSSTQYYWRAAIRRNNDVLGQWTSPMTLTKTSVTPTPIYPLTGDPLTLVTEQPTFLWTGILTPTVEPRLATPKYRLEVDDDPTFGSPIIRIDTAATGYTPIEGSRQSLADGKWYWRVAIFESSGNPGPFSTAQAFDKQYQVPTLVWPPPNTKAGVMPSFEWLPLTGAAYYRFEISKDSEFEKVQTEDTVNTAYTPTSAFNNGFYFWRVRMFDQDRVAGPTMIGRFNLGYEIFMPKPSAAHNSVSAKEKSLPQSRQDAKKKQDTWL